MTIARVILNIEPIRLGWLYRLTYNASMDQKVPMWRTVATEAIAYDVSKRLQAEAVTGLVMATAKDLTELRPD